MPSKTRRPPDPPVVKEPPPVGKNGSDRAPVHRRDAAPPADHQARKQGGQQPRIKDQSGKPSAVVRPATRRDGALHSTATLHSAATWWTLVGLVALALVIYGNNLHNGFVYDDNDAIVRNEAAHGLRHTVQIFTTASWWPATESEVRHYRPLTTWTYAVNYSLDGLKPDGYHLTNNLLHALAAWLVYLVLVASGMGIPAAASAAVLFLTHPVHVESVSWVNSRADILAGGFILLALLAHIQSIHIQSMEQGGARRAALAAAGVFSFLLAGLSKETGYMAPFVVLAWDVLFRDRLDLRQLGRRLRAGDWMEYAGYAVALAGFALVRAHLVGGATVATVTPMATPLGGPGAGFTDRLFTGSYVIARYAWLLLWPARLTVDYSPAEITRISSLADPRALLGLGVLLAGLGLMAVTARRSKLTCFALAAALLVFAPGANILFPVGTIMAERLMYLPVLALCVPLALAIWNLRRWTRENRGPIAVATLIALAYSVRSMVRNGDWKDEMALFQSAQSASPRSAMANKNLGSILHDQGREEEAIVLCRRATTILPEFWQAHMVLGGCYFNTHRYPEAVQEYLTTIRLQPRDAAPHADLGATYHEMGRYRDALRELNAAIALNPQLDLPWFNRIHTLVALGKIDEAENALAQANDRFPNDGYAPAARAKIDSAGQQAPPAAPNPVHK